MLMEGNQVLVLNEWDKGQGFYRLFQAEKRLRMLADSYENCYVIGIFACCRQIYTQSAFENIGLHRDEVKKIQEEAKLNQE